MPSTALNRLLDLAKMRLPGALDSALAMELFIVLDEFFQASNLWQDNIEFAVTATTKTYFEDPDAYTYDLVPDFGKVARLLYVMDGQGNSVGASMPTLEQAVLANSPQAAATYTARVVLTVADPVTSTGYPDIPEWVLMKYNTGILDGLLGRMMSQLAKPYSSMVTAAAHLRRFKSTKSMAKIEAMNRNVYGAQIHRFPVGFSGNGR